MVSELAPLFIFVYFSGQLSLLHSASVRGFVYTGNCCLLNGKANPDALIDFSGIYTLLEEHRDLHSM